MVLCCLRTLITTVLMLVGVSYLIKCNDYADIIMNGVALLFIAEISSVLYSQVLREEIKDQTEDIKPMKVPMYGVEWLNRQPALVDVISVTVLAIVVIYIMHWQLTSIVVPVHDALQCTCTNSGPHCVEAQKFNSAFWNKYWTSAVPGVYHEIGKLKKVKTMINTGSYGSVVPAISDDNSAPRLAMEARMEELERSNEKLQMQLQELEEAKFKSSINRKKEVHAESTKKSESTAHAESTEQTSINVHSILSHFSVELLSLHQQLSLIRKYEYPYKVLTKFSQVEIPVF